MSQALAVVGAPVLLLALFLVVRLVTAFRANTPERGDQWTPIRGGYARYRSSFRNGGHAHFAGGGGAVGGGGPGGGGGGGGGC
ncbi:putative membrane protein YgcG [Actinopolyspora biskrensis]|uniref:Putative membrane protein YgcG n=1 Tax=Actinopolyspora biskrensis TaxID=1470178 RepID=A0A852Z7M8_9ACTN|nr:hypothetical protein [Actinopolyspora biskrensis]NYH78467.1 putative membrane protein YgcG [Actinopolyspora biskrensis]